MRMATGTARLEAPRGPGWRRPAGPHDADYHPQRMDAYEVANWDGFAIAMLGAAAVLVGLIFVACP